MASIADITETWGMSALPKIRGTLLFIYEDIPSKLIITKMTIEWFFVEINLRKTSESFAAHITQKNH